MYAAKTDSGAGTEPAGRLGADWRTTDVSLGPAESVYTKPTTC